MKVIYKYSLGVITNSVTHMLPADYQVVKVAQQDRGGLYVWVLHSADPNVRKIPVEFAVLATGEPFDDLAWMFVGTLQANDNFHMWHVIMKIPYVANAEEPEPETWFRNQYHCESCDTEWEDRWSAACDDECPDCGVSISPHESEVIA